MNLQEGAQSRFKFPERIAKIDFEKQIGGS
jgi:hypothetical protein